MIIKRDYYSDSIGNFFKTTTEEILGKLALRNYFSLEQTQRSAWLVEISILRKILSPRQGTIYFEYSIPRMGRRIDVVLLIGPVIFVLEFKVGEKDFLTYAIDQVWDYALDLKNFHDTSHEQYIAPVLIATEAKNVEPIIALSPQNDKLFDPIKTNVDLLSEVIENVLSLADSKDIDQSQWESGRYCPTPTIIEAAMALYNNHLVTEISRSDAGALNLSKTSDAISDVIRLSKDNAHKAICFVTGVPGSGKTLVGLNIATKHMSPSDDLYSVFLSGNGPLVKILREALARDKVRRGQEYGEKIKIGEARSKVKSFIQNVHEFRDESLRDPNPPKEHVTLFDEAQRAWNAKQTSSFMRRKKDIPDFKHSEPEFLISCLDRHPDWAVIVCLVGGGQEINTGEAGISEWIESLNRSFHDWHIYISPHLTDNEYGAEDVLKQIESRKNVNYKEELHLAVSMRSFRSEHVSLLVKQLIDLDVEEAQKTHDKLKKSIR